MPTPQPVKAVLAMRRIPQARLAEVCGFSATYANQVVNGHAPPSERFRRAVAAFLDLPEAELFNLDRCAA